MPSLTPDGFINDVLTKWDTVHTVDYNGQMEHNSAVPIAPGIVARFRSPTESTHPS